LASYAEVVIGLLDHLKLTKVNIVGLSIGGAIAQYLGIYHAERINHLFLSNTCSKLGSAETWEARIRLVKEKGIIEIADQIMKIWFSESFHLSNPESIAGYKTMVSNINLNGYVMACETLKNSDLRSEVSRIKLPTFCIAGTKDGSTSPELVKSLADSIENSDYFLIEGVGHIPCVETPEIIAKYLMKVC
jgi:3-oxoadipate enol-lactonase